MKAWEIIGYTFDADTHCPDCTFDKFGRNLPPEFKGELDDNGVPVEAEDSEGNQVHPIFASDESADPKKDTCCGTCGDVIAEATDPEDKPDDDDYFMWDSREGVAVSGEGKFLGAFKTRDEAEAFIRDRGNKDGW